MFTKHKHFKLSSVFYTLLFLSTLNACSVLSGHDSKLKPEPFAAMEHDSSWYSSQLSASVPEYNYDWQILLARAYSNEGNTGAASEVLSQMRESAITPLQGNIADIIEAQIKSKSGNYKAAANLLNSVNVMSLPKDVANYYYSLSARVNEANGKYLDAGLNYLNLADSISNNDKSEIYERASSALSKAAPKDLMNAFRQSKANGDDLTCGFIEYALISKNQSAKSKERLLKSFEEKYPDHPVLSKKATQHETASNEKAFGNNIGNGDTIAVFLPLTGPYAKIIGNPVKIGILSSYRDRGISVNLKFYDTAASSIPVLYNQALNDKAKVIIGPIIKEQVNELLAQRPAVPVIALNQGNSQPNVSNVYYLTLAPENDMFNASLEMQRDRIQSPVIIAPRNERGDRMANSLNSYWSTANNKGISLCYYEDMNTIENTVKGCLNSYRAYDGVYIYGTPLETSKIKDSARAYIGDSATYYAGAKSNDGLTQSAIATSLNGIKLGDQPWMLKDSGAKQRIQEILPKANGDTLRSFAIGYDSLNLALHLHDLTANHQQSIRGLSGDISISENGKLKRIITWIKVGN
ncbi:penicillin-binding protein activator [Ruminobacter sp. RM87]|uniref:penicillin-binding protein activator n=1 Tax=Ruminobacter sp. RM87 TaxID=1200567 RepID=UPI0004E0B24D|nr:penicillin-binding protein activator [Ruminobacter sp. RM87]